MLAPVTAMEPYTQASSRRMMTFEDAAKLNPDEQPGEIVDGEWIAVTRSTWRLGEVTSAINFLLRRYAREHKGWSVSVADPGVKLANDPTRLRGPDVGMVRAERVPKGKGVDGWLEGAPDVAVEVVGDSQSISELIKKALEYITAGAQMVWLVDTDPQRVVLVTPPDHIKILGKSDVLDGADVLPGFQCTVSEMFE